MSEELNISDCVEKGIDGIDFSWSMQAVEDKLGPCEERKVYEDKRTDSESVYLNYYQQGISFVFKDSRLTTFFLYGGIPCGYETGRFKRYQFKTPLNISFDTKLEEIKAICGDPRRENANKFAPVPCTTLSYIGFTFDVCLNDGMIGAIIITEG